MDQDAFRSLLASETSSSAPRAEAHWPPKRKHKEKEATKPLFKPRKPTVDKYRDRATERRGGANDYAEVEKVLADFEKVSTGMEADKVEEQRKYLGGDEQHTVLVKGLDFALLEQQKAKLNSKQDVEDEKRLEEAFLNATAPKKRTREEIVEELKKSRMDPAAAAPPVDVSLEMAKQSGKFRPIGAPDVKAKKRKPKDFEESNKKKKKRKVEVETREPKVETTSITKPSEPEEADAVASSSNPPQRPKSPSPAFEVDADIFADAEEWKGLGSDSDSDEGLVRPDPRPTAPRTVPPVATGSRLKANWFGEKTGEIISVAPKREVKEVVPKVAQEEEEEPEQPRRLQGLASSAVPSIREILAMDEAAGKEEKRKARKEKKKDKKKPSEDTRINREVKQLEQYVATKSK